MTGFDLATVLANLRVVGMLVLLTAFDWVLGVILALRAGAFDWRKVPGVLGTMAEDVLGLVVAAGATGLVLSIGGVDVHPVLAATFVALAIADAAKLLAELKDKIAALGTAATAKAYFTK